MFDKLTKSDIEKMEAEIEHRKVVVRKEALEAVKEARAHGDLSENFEYKAAKQYKNQNEGRIRYLEKMIKTAQIIEDESTDDEVGLNKEVTVEFIDMNRKKTFVLVTTVLGNSREGKISIDSPIGMAVKGKKVGDEAEFTLPNGNVSKVKILEIKKYEGELELRKF
ncbi:MULTISPECIES: transcription elongation factor GreA [Eubacterium]|uniref:Transcription elongation factor GreA n=1 Tax=Eubacterium uniforme TaxID=39495 RepID=A0A1T4VGX1_9FIRM|nr:MULTISPECIES: transcription elongation factor GreA [Eubacterium]MCR5630063.1 transcription elongation factor GreA [Eubacterium sp.]SKA64176.1 transcription elongation factor GreA [Eubacterium uniforme]HAH18474.1 transcription elongation factor GreA [Eubacterium sp.]